MIPPEIKEKLNADDFYKKCALGLFTCSGSIEFHHVFQYAGSSIQKGWAIVPACKLHHDMVKTSNEVRESFERIALSRATDKDLEEFPNKNWNQLKEYLNI
jgi:hypothetical protein